MAEYCQCIKCKSGSKEIGLDVADRASYEGRVIVHIILLDLDTGTREVQDIFLNAGQAARLSIALTQAIARTH